MGNLQIDTFYIFVFSLGPVWIDFRKVKKFILKTLEYFGKAARHFLNHALLAPLTIAYSLHSHHMTGKARDYERIKERKQFLTMIPTATMREQYGHGMKGTYFSPRSRTPLRRYDVLFEWEDKISSPRQRTLLHGNGMTLEWENEEFSPFRTPIRRETPTMVSLCISSQKPRCSMASKLEP